MRINSKLSALIIFIALGSFLSAQSKEKDVTKDEIVNIIPEIDVKAEAPKGVNLGLMSKDPTYGFSDQNPIRVGAGHNISGPKAEQIYLSLLLDARGKRVKFKRLFSGGNDPKGSILDCYEVITSDETKVKLWISMYSQNINPYKQQAPVGFYKLKKLK